MQRAILDALAALFSALARAQPLVVLLEDWHWADQASEVALRHVAAATRDEPVLLLVSHRPDEGCTAQWRDEARVDLRLLPLSEGETAHVVESLLESAPPRLIERIHERTGGDHVTR